MLLAGGVAQAQQVCAFSIIEIESVGDGVEDSVGRSCVTSLLEALVVVGAEAGEDGDLLAAKASHAASATGLKPKLLRCRLLPTRAQEQTQLTSCR